MASDDPFLEALAELDRVLDENTQRTKLMKRRIAYLKRHREAGKPWTEIVDDETPPLVVQLLTESDQALGDAGARVRRTEALALHDDGMTMDRIAALFGVSRQRVSGLLREARSDKNGR